jgi:hypothetical protein
MAAHSMIKENYGPILLIVIIGGDINNKVVDAYKFAVDIDSKLLAGSEIRLRVVLPKECSRDTKA